MNNFLEFIKKDIDAKRTLIETLPTKTKTNQKRLNKEIELILEKYKEYITNTKNYLIAKEKKLEINEPKDNIDKLKEKVTTIERLKFLLNPSNTYFEKMGFDALIYKISNFDTFNFSSLNDIINEFLDKFELVGISLRSSDFDYTCYVHEYMSSFLDVRYHVTKSYDKVSQIFEQIYFLNPELINHIELNFRKLIKSNEKKFNSYIVTLQKEVMSKENINNYAVCLEKLQSAYIELNMEDTESISEIIDMTKEGTINVEQYFEDNKTRKSAFDSLIPESVDITNPKEMGKICGALDKLRLNIEEYNSYIEFNEIFTCFRDEYKDLIKTTDTKVEYKGLKDIIDTINKKENELEKINKKVFSGKPGLFEFKNDNDLKRLKRDSVFRAKELYELYKTYDIEYFKSRIMDILSETLSVSDVLNLYYSYDYFKKLTIQKVYNLKDYESILKYSENFDLFAMNPTNIIIAGVPIFSDTNISKTIANKYRLNNIKVTEDDLSEENLSNLLNKILLILRVDKINNSKISIDELWFIAEVEKIINKESKKV